MKRLIVLGLFVNAALLAGLLVKDMGADAIGRDRMPFSFLTPEQAEILQHMSIVYLPAGEYAYDSEDPEWQPPETVKTIRITGVNVQIVNGEGSTQTMNGAGNLIVGYQESYDPPLCYSECNGLYSKTIRTGSHNIIVGRGNSYEAASSIVAGDRNRSLGWNACVVGGVNNIAGANDAFVGGGVASWALEDGSAIIGGLENLESTAWTGILGENNSFQYHPCFNCDE